MKGRLLIAAIAAALVILAGNDAVFAQRGGRTQEVIEVRIGSPLPRESPWGRTLDRIAAEWSRVTGGQVRLRVLHGGTEGGEGKMHLSLASNTIQAAVFTSFGLASINPAIMTMSVPFLIRNEAELAVVMDQLHVDLEARINSGDYFIVAWSKAGFVNVFSKDPVFTPDDLKKIRLATNVEAEDMNVAFKSMGFQLVDTDWTDVGPKLATNTISAIYQNPAGVAAMQLQNYLKNMLSVNIAPVLGGIVINQVTWRRIGAADPRFQQEIVRVTRQIAAELDASMQRTVSDAVNSMARAGLRVNTPNAAQEKLWYDDIEKVTPGLIGSTYDRDLYQKIDAILTRYRSGR